MGRTCRTASNQRCNVSCYGLYAIRWPGARPKRDRKFLYIPESGLVGSACPSDYTAGGLNILYAKGSLNTIENFRMCSSRNNLSRGWNWETLSQASSKMDRLLSAPMQALSNIWHRSYSNTCLLQVQILQIIQMWLTCGSCIIYGVMTGTVLFPNLHSWGLQSRLIETVFKYTNLILNAWDPIQVLLQPPPADRPSTQTQLILHSLQTVYFPYSLIVWAASDFGNWKQRVSRSALIYKVCNRPFYVYVKQSVYGPAILPFFNRFTKNKTLHVFFTQI